MTNPESVLSVDDLLRGFLNAAAEIGLRIPADLEKIAKRVADEARTAASNCCPGRRIGIRGQRILFAREIIRAIARESSRKNGIVAKAREDELWRKIGRCATAPAEVAGRDAHARIAWFDPMCWTAWSRLRGDGEVRCAFRIAAELLEAQERGIRAPVGGVR